MVQCLIVEAGVLQQVGLNQDELQDAVMSAHEASERLLGHIRDTYCSDTYRCETDVPIPLTTGKMAERGKLIMLVSPEIGACTIRDVYSIKLLVCEAWDV